MTPEELQKAVSTAGQGVVCAYFTAGWCRACASTAKVVERYNESSDLLLYTVDMDTSMELADLYDVSRLPTFVFFKHGDVAGVQCGGGVDVVDGAFRKVLNLVD